MPTPPPLTETRLLPASEEAILEAASALLQGGLVAFPTETVYGLGANAGNSQAVARLYAAKGRPAFNPLIAHVGSLAAAREFAVFDATAEALARAFWPGPLTLVLPRRENETVCDLACAGLNSVGVRVPQHLTAQALIAAVGRPLVAPSANRSGHVSPTTSAHVMADLAGRVDIILDAPGCAVGVESSIVACLTEPTWLRPGGVPRDAIEQLIGMPLRDPSPTASQAPQAPGLLESHYAPRAQLRLDIVEVRPGESLIAFGPPLPGAAVMTNLSPRGDVVEAAANLFGHLRQLDRAGASRIAVMRIPRHGLGEAINDRLARAAAPRP